MSIPRYTDSATRLSPEVEEAIFTLIARHSTQDDELATFVSDLSQSWVDLAPLYEVAVRLLALFTHNANLVDGQMLAKLTKRLIHTEVAPGGPYADFAGEPDILTNAAIAQLFTTLHAPLPNLRIYLEAQVRSLEDIQPVQYSWVLLWPHTIASYPDETTKYLTRQLPSVALSSPKDESDTLTHVAHIVSTTAESVRHDINQLPESIRKPATIVWQSIVSADKYQEISLLSSEFVASLSVKFASHAKHSAQLDQANFCVWMAYTLYDDFIDEEGDPSILPLANIFHRKSFTLLYNYTKLHSIKKMVSKQFDSMDEANIWEVAQCRFVVRNGVVTIHQLPHYGNRHILARRAGVHGLGPMMIVTCDAGYSSKQVANLRSYFQDYLIARQLNDDVHDWKDDLRKGHASFVVTFLLRASRIKPGTYNIEHLIKTLQKYFWKTGLEQLLVIILRHTDKALIAAKTSQLFIEDAPFLSMTIQPIIDSVHASRVIVRNKKDYFDTYKLVH